MELPIGIYQNRFSESGHLIAWDSKSAHDLVKEENAAINARTTERALKSSSLIPSNLNLSDIVDENGLPPKRQVLASLEQEAKRKRTVSLILQEHQTETGLRVLFLNDKRGGRHWVYLKADDDMAELVQALEALADERNVLLWPLGPVTTKLRNLQTFIDSNQLITSNGKKIKFSLAAYEDPIEVFEWDKEPIHHLESKHLSHLDRLEAESIHILREVVAQAKNPGMLFSLGKDSCVMLHLAKKAFYPSPPPFPLIHVDTQWKFQAMYRLRDEIARTSGTNMIIHINPEAKKKNINPFDHGSELHTHVTKTEGLIQVLEKYQIDVALGGARRDEEKSRAKERVFSIRTSTHRWDPKKQRPELWDLYNGYKEKDESIRAFPLSDWTELDIWRYIQRESIEIPGLYFAKKRPVVERGGTLLMVDDERFPLHQGEVPEMKSVRFRTLGCYPLSGAVESTADNLVDLIAEMETSKVSERSGRLIDGEGGGSMEAKKAEGYF